MSTALGTLFGATEGVDEGTWVGTVLGTLLGPTDGDDEGT